MRASIHLASLAALLLAVQGSHEVAYADPEAPTPAATIQPKAPVLTGLGDAHRHPITTRSPEAQAYFDQGLRLIYAFNHDEATRAFEECARIDAGAAMCFWGVALAAGPNYNSPIDAARDRRAWQAIQQAKALSVKATPAEQDYIAALAVRHTSEAPTERQALDVAYADAMRALAKRHPGDMDAQTLFAESMMDLRPWDLWSNDGEPRPGTLEIVATLETVLKQDPKHPGANHYYIHAVEASKHPERGIPSAERIGAIAPAARHVADMAPPEMMREMPMLEGIGASPLFVMARFGQWDAILAEPAPPQDLAFWTGLWHYARGLAYTRKGQLPEARADEKLVAQAAATVPADHIIMQVNSAKTLLEIASHDLAGEIAAADGETDLAVRELRTAVTLQDELRYMEPPPWYLPERQALGAVLLKAGRAKEAEAIYREDLARNPENAWSLRGLALALRAQKKGQEAAAAEARFEKASARADMKLVASRL